MSPLQQFGKPTFKACAIRSTNKAPGVIFLALIGFKFVGWLAVEALVSWSIDIALVNGVLMAEPKNRCFEITSTGEADSP